MTTSEDDLVDVLARRLADRRLAASPAEFLSGAQGADGPGLYAWWADADGLAALAVPFGVTLPSLIYAGQAGATSTRSKTERVATLRSRICSNHLNGNIGSSTFRKTLSSVLAEPLDLRLAGAGRLDAPSNRRVSAWMRSHLRVSIAGVADRSTLAELEHAVLHRLDPPLNIMGMQPTPVRRELRRLRAGLSFAPQEEPPAVTVTRTSRSETADGRQLPLHEAMVEVLKAVEWLTFRQLADQIAASGLYLRKDGEPATTGQVRMRATLSRGQYVHLFEVEGDRIRLCQS